MMKTVTFGKFNLRLFLGKTITQRSKNDSFAEDTSVKEHAEDTRPIHPLQLQQGPLPSAYPSCRISHVQNRSAMTNSSFIIIYGTKQQQHVCY